MGLRYICAATLFAVAIGFQINSIRLFWKMKDDVNQVLPHESQIPEFGPSWLQGKVIRLHRQHYPNSILCRNLYRSWWVTLAAFVSALACVVRFK